MVPFKMWNYVRNCNDGDDSENEVAHEGAFCGYLVLEEDLLAAKLVIAE